MRKLSPTSSFIPKQISRACFCWQHFMQSKVRDNHEGPQDLTLEAIIFNFTTSESPEVSLFSNSVNDETSADASLVANSYKNKIQWILRTGCLAICSKKFPWHFQVFQTTCHKLPDHMKVILNSFLLIYTITRGHGHVDHLGLNVMSHYCILNAVFLVLFDI